MTYHISYNHQCPQCQAFYIPYDDDVPCPRCGLVESQRFDFIRQAAISLSINKKNGSYAPKAWWVGSFSDQILFRLFMLFNAYEKRNPPDFPAFAASEMAKVNWGEHPYLKDHFIGIAVRVHELVQPDKQ